MQTWVQSQRERRHDLLAFNLIFIGIKLRHNDLVVGVPNFQLGKLPIGTRAIFISIVDSFVYIFDVSDVGSGISPRR